MASRTWRNPGTGVLSLGLCAFLGASACSSGDSSTGVGGSSGSAQGGSSGSGGSGGSGQTGGSGGSAQGGSSGSDASSQGGSGNGGTPDGGGTGGQGGTSSPADGGTGGTGGAQDSGADAVRPDAGACNTAPGKALQFRATTIDLMAGDLGTDLPPGDVPRTIEAWVKYLGAASWVAEGSILETGRATGGQNRVFGLDNSGYNATTSTAQFGPYTNGYSDNNNPNGVFVTNIPQVGWIHLSWSYAGNRGALSFTVNGTSYPVITQAGAPTLNFTTGVVTLGASQNFGFGGFDGILDEVRIWSIARTPAEIARDMRVVLKGTEPGLVAYYRFDEGAGSFTNDVTGTAAHRLSTCTAVLEPRCASANNGSPTWVDSDLPGPFTCAP